MPKPSEIPNLNRGRKIIPTVDTPNSKAALIVDNVITVRNGTGKIEPIFAKE